MFKYFIIYFLSQYVVGSLNAQIFLPNVDCGSFIDYVATDPVRHRYTPYYIKLNRCHGVSLSSLNPSYVKCEAVSSNITNIKIYVYLADGRQEFLEVQNHTVCKQTCILKAVNCTQYETYKPDTCTCPCNYKTAPKPNPCTDPFFWDNTKCNCMCKHTTPLKCEKRKEFSSSICGCTCKEKFRLRCQKGNQVLDPASCQCVDPKVITGSFREDCETGIQGGILAVIMIIEALVFVIAYFFLYSYCYKRKYLPIKNKNKNSGYYQNGNVPSANRANEFNTISVEDEEDYVPKQPNEDKNLIKEDERLQQRENLAAGPIYYPDEEKSPPSKQNGEWYLYNDIMEVDVPNNNSSSISDRLRPYTGNVSSDLSEDGYGSVTVV